MIFLSPPPLLLKQKAASISRLNRDLFLPGPKTDHDLALFRSLTSFYPATFRC